MTQDIGGCFLISGSHLEKVTVALEQRVEFRQRIAGKQQIDLMLYHRRECLEVQMFSDSKASEGMLLLKLRIASPAKEQFSITWANITNRERGRTRQDICCWSVYFLSLSVDCARREEKGMSSDSIQAQGPNAAQIEYWNTDAGDTWVRNQQLLDDMLTDISEHTLLTADIAAGMQVLDVGCGCGATALRLSQIGARVTGIDISEPMLKLAQERAREVKLDIQFLLSDAETLNFEARYDLLFSRFGVMFFAEPVAAFSNLQRALKPGGRLHFVCWQAPSVNPWMSAPMAAALTEMPPMEAPDPRAPGPFAFADPGYVNEILAQSGFSEVEVKPYRTRIRLAPDVDEAFHFFWQLSPLARLLKDADADTSARIGSKVRKVFVDHTDGEGIVMDAACWLVSGNKV